MERRRYNPRRRKDKDSVDLGRRRLLALAAAGTVAATSGVLFLASRSRGGGEAFHFQSTHDTQPSKGEFLPGGELISEKELISFYNKAIKERAAVEANPTIIKSTLYHALKSFGMSDELARIRADRVVIADKVEQACVSGSSSCVYDKDKGLIIELGPNFFVSADSSAPWEKALSELSHEAFHLNVDLVDDTSSVESYGILGSAYIASGRRGFSSTERYDGILGGLIKFRNNHSIIEEFSAELGRRRNIARLVSNGLNPIKDMSGYHLFTQGLMNFEDTKGDGKSASWQAFLGNLSFSEASRLHRENNREEFFRRFGQAVVRNNPQAKVLDAELTKAAGVVAFTDFANHPVTGYNILFSLSQKPLNETVILQSGTDLSRRIANLR